MFNFFVIRLNKRQNGVVGGVAVALLRLQIAVNNILTGNTKVVERHDLVLNHILYFLNGNGVPRRLAQVFYVERSKGYLALSETLTFGNFFVCC